MQIEIETEYCPKGEYELKFMGKYVDGSPALGVWTDMKPMFRATVCLNEKPAPGHVFIKDWSENEGVLQALVGAGVIEPPIRSIPTGYVEAFECKLTDPVIRNLRLEWWSKQ